MPGRLAQLGSEPNLLSSGITFSTNVLNLSLSLSPAHITLSRQLSLPHAVTLLPRTLGLKPSLNLISRPREPPIGVEDLLLHVLLPGVLWIPSSLREKGLIQDI